MNNMTDDFAEAHGRAADFTEQVRRNQTVDRTLALNLTALHEAVRRHRSF